MNREPQSADKTSREWLERSLRAVESARAEVEQWRGRAHAPIAIVGQGLRLPGGIEEPRELAQKLGAGEDLLEDFPAERAAMAGWSALDVCPELGTQRGGFLSEPFGFEPERFGIAPKEAPYIDPQQRWILECAWRAIDDAGLERSALYGTPTGCFIGISTVDWSVWLASQIPKDRLSAISGLGSAHASAAGRLAYLLGTQGPTLCVDTACSSSLVALHLAVNSLQQMECDLALVGGVNALLQPHTGLAFGRARMLSRLGRCASFAADADGYVRSEGAAVFVLERQSDALRNGRVPLGLILGSAINSDGRSSGLTAPNGPAQERVLRAALKRAKLNASAIGYIEAHGTGTPLGDPIELGALARVFEGTAAPLYVAAAKAHFGHLEAAAGALSVAKVLAQLERREIFAQPHCARPTTHFDWKRSPLRVPQSSTPWLAREGRRVAGVSSFGFTGSNAHILIGEAEVATRPARTRRLFAPYVRKRYLPPWLERADASSSPGALERQAAEAHLKQGYVLLPPVEANFALARFLVVGEGPLAQGLANLARQAGAQVETAPIILERAAIQSRLASSSAERILLVHAALEPASAGFEQLDLADLCRDLEQEQLWITAAARSGRLGLTQVVERAHSLPGQLLPPCPRSAALLAVGRCAALELPGLELRRLDSQGLESLKAGISELLRADAEREVCLRGQVAFAPRWQPAASTSPATQKAAAPRCVLMIGGISPVGLVAAQSLAQTGTQQIFFASRSLKQETALQALREQGVACEQVLLDVGELGALAALQKRLATRGIRPDLLLLTAGVLDDGALVETDAGRFQRVLRPKVLAAVQALAWAEAQNACSVRLFSSAAAHLGNPGQAAYAAANACAEALLQAGAQRGLDTFALVFGPWASGMAARSANAARWNSLGLRPLGDDLARRALGVALSDPWPLRVVIDADFRRLSERLAVGNGCLLKELLPTDAKPLETGRAPFERWTEQKPSAEQELWLTGCVAEELERALGLARGRLPPDKSPLEMGLDSLLALELSQRLSSGLRFALQPSKVLGAPSFEELKSQVYRAFHLESALRSGDPGALAVCIAELEEDEVQLLLSQGLLA